MTPRTTNRTTNRLHRTLIRSFAALGLLAYGTAWSMDDAGASLNGWAVGGGIIAVLALGLYLQSIRRRIA